jgi:hypothetical protein
MSRRNNRFYSRRSSPRAHPFGSPLLTRPVEGPKPPSVILISLDTLRGEFVGQVRDGVILTENIDAFGRQGVTFSKAMTTYPSTTASHMSILTGVYPSKHHVVAPDRHLAGEIPIAAQLFAEAGYFTGAVTENAMISPSSGFERGFDFYREEHGTSHEHALGFIEATLATATRWVRKHGKDSLFPVRPLLSGPLPLPSAGRTRSLHGLARLVIGQNSTDAPQQTERLYR